MSSSNFLIRWDSVGVGGDDTSSSSSYQVRDSVEFIQGTSDSSNYRVDGGYRGGIYDPVVTFEVFAQDTATQVAATAISSDSVDVTSSSGFAAGDYIVVVQNEGTSQVEAIGRISSIAGTTLNIDFFSYSSSLPVIDSVNDYVYALSGSSVPLASISPGAITTGVVGWEVAADVPTGYSVYVREDQDLQSGTNAIDDVADGSVTQDSEEYGGRSSDLTLASSTFDTADTAFTSTLQQVASRSAAAFQARDFVTLKAAADDNTVNGAYSHTLTFVMVGNY